jgi:hypothetical protein
MDKLIEKALGAKRESKYIEFKESFDPSSPGEWLEIIKDILAIANSGGGVILFGVDNKGELSGADVSSILSIDPATMTDKIYKYTDIQFSDFEFVDCQKGEARIAALKILSNSTPIVFTKPGTYNVGEGKQKNAFSKGTVYFRHGAKSEPGNTSDLQSALERNLNEIRKSWMQGVRKVVQAPSGSQVQILPSEVVESQSSTATPIRIVDDPLAPAFYKINPDESHPFRQTEAIAEVNKKLPDKYQINQYDILSARRVYNLDDKDEYCYNSKFGSRQYSKEFVYWLVEQFNKDNNFFIKARREYYRITH